MMNHKRFLVTLSLLLLTLGGLTVLPAQALTVEELLLAMPPENAASGALLFEKAFEEGPELIRALCKRITPSAEGVDAEAKFALYGLAKHGGRPDNKGQAPLMARILEEAIRASDSAEVRSFFMSILRFCADDASIAVLAGLICDEESSLDVIQTIENIGGEAALTVLSLADCPQAAEAIAQAKARLRNQAPYTSEETGLSESMLQLVLNPEGCTDKAAAAGQCREALANMELPRPTRCIVLRALVELIGKEALPELLDAQNSTDSVYQGWGRELARALPGEDVSQAWIFRLDEYDAFLKGAVIALLGERNDPSAQMAVLNALGDRDAEIRQAACMAISAAFGEQAVAPLLDAFERAESDAELQAIKGALLRLPELEATVLGLMTPDALLYESLTAEQTIASLDIIAERKATQFQEFVLDKIEAEDAKIRRSAFQALAVIGDEADLDQLLASVLKEKRDGEAEVAAAALVSLARDLEKGDETIEKLAERLDTAEEDPALRLIRALASFGDAQAVAPVKAAVEKRIAAESANAKWLRNAFETLAVWPQAEAREALLDLWKNTEADEHRKTALKCYITSVERSISDKKAQIEAFTAAKEFAANDKETKSLDDAASKIKGKK
ncbi:MAG: HEAT repeat domain-containing protein [Candidatus Hydrogenedens sp.]|jgi:hypothetical protein|nr:HEAT repeat domain-containing protein [Candidatus Hydrogenedens sp.]